MEETCKGLSIHVTCESMWQCHQDGCCLFWLKAPLHCESWVSGWDRRSRGTERQVRTTAPSLVTTARWEQETFFCFWSVPVTNSMKQVQLQFSHAIKNCSRNSPVKRSFFFWHVVSNHCRSWGVLKSKYSYAIHSFCFCYRNKING